jgi:hypothetical protein
MEKLFQGKGKYATKEIVQTLPLNLQLFLWSCIEERVSRDEVMDYLQVFRLQNIYDPNRTGNRVTRIVHSQEIPEYESTYILSDGSFPVEGTIFVIDDGNVVTMLWGEEY